MGYESVKKSIEWAGIAISGLQLISKLTKTTADDEAATTLASIRQVAEALEKGATGEVNLTKCEQEIQRLLDANTSADERVDARVDQRFPPGDD